MDDILTASQVAKLLQIHPRTVYKLVRQGVIPGRKFGGGWRFSRNDIVSLLSSDHGKKTGLGQHGEAKPAG
ncbi:MAG TPA: helix-turn-helix domain-containing protein [candidate division Zixibacteria bacterium]|nr:helix-turn-helix domain-containing protein [candidate division Zixibacteria bacterium]